MTIVDVIEKGIVTTGSYGILALDGEKRLWEWLGIQIYLCFCSLQGFHLEYIKCASF